jgi:hypothetical protein
VKSRQQRTDRRTGALSSLPEGSQGGWVDKLGYSITIPATLNASSTPGTVRGVSSMSGPVREWRGPGKPLRLEVRDLAATRHGLDCAGFRIAPQRVPTTLALQIAAVAYRITKQIATPHFTITGSRSASGGNPRSASSRRSSRISFIASDRLRRASSLVFACPLAPGISAQ